MFTRPAGSAGCRPPVFAPPWMVVATPPDPTAECTIFAARLPLRSKRAVPTVVRHAIHLRQHLNAAPGLLGFTLGVDLAPAALWTVSAWRDRAALGEFERSAAHRTAKKALREQLTPSTFAIWAAPAGDLPIPWTEVRRRVALAGRA